MPAVPQDPSRRAEAITCIRCGVATIALEDWPGLHHDQDGPLRGWEGSPSYEPVCPGCQYVEWHPHCLALIDVSTG
jgi:hypothetical protein